MKNNYPTFFSSVIFSFIFFLFSLSAAHAAIWYVKAEAPNGGDGTTWNLAFNKIQDAVTIATSSDQIWVKKGTYALSAQINVTGEEKLYGGFNGNETASEPEKLENQCDNY